MVPGKSEGKEWKICLQPNKAVPKYLWAYYTCQFVNTLLHVFMHMCEPYIYNHVFLCI